MCTGLYPVTFKKLGIFTKRRILIKSDCLATGVGYFKAAFEIHCQVELDTLLQLFSYYLRSELLIRTLLTYLKLIDIRSTK